MALNRLLSAALHAGRRRFAQPSRQRAVLSAVILATLFGGSAWLSEDARANFSDSAGFSGRGGATCIACHTAAPFPLTPPPAAAILEGLPAEGWEVGKTYTLTIRVEGGPQAMPAPAPQGGFDLSLDAGTVAVPAGSEDLLRTPNPQEITYRPAGTMMREWQVEWTAPSLAERPRDVHVWLAVLAANGNHVVATNTSDGGERLDSAASLTAQVPPSAGTQDAWRALPLLPPAAQAEVVGDLRSVVSGRHADGNATHIAWRVDGGAWRQRETGADWAIRLDGLAAGQHRVDVRSEGADRASPDVPVLFDVPGLDLPGDRDAPGPPAAFLLLLLACLAILARSRPHP